MFWSYIFRIDNLQNAFFVLLHANSAMHAHAMAYSLSVLEYLFASVASVFTFQRDSLVINDINALFHPLKCFWAHKTSLGSPLFIDSSLENIQSHI
jgi:hypothetical protein